MVVVVVFVLLGGGGGGNSIKYSLKTLQRDQKYFNQRTRQLVESKEDAFCLNN